VATVYIVEAFPPSTVYASFTVTQNGASTPPSITNLVPKGGESYVKGSSQVISWTYTPGTPPASSTTGTIDLLYNGAPVSTLASAVPLSSQTLSWTVPSNVTAGTTYQIRITPGDPGTYPAVSGSFAITDPPCTFTAKASTTNPNLQFTYAGGTGGIDITGSPSTCASSISNDSPGWLTLTGNILSGTGNWTPTFTIPANSKLNASTQQRTANLVVTGTSSGSGTPFSQKFSVTQSGLQCNYTLNPAALSLPPEGILQSAAAKIAVTTSASACQWTASSSSISVHLIQSGSSPNTGSGSVLFWVDANNTGADRTDKIQIGDQSAIGVQGYIKDPPKTFSADGEVKPPPQGGVDLSQVTVELDTYPASSRKITAKVDPKTGKWQATGLLVGNTYQAVVVLHQADSNKYDTLPLSIDDVTVANATNLNFRILKKPHGLFIGRKPITSGSNEYQQIIVAVSKVDPDLGIYAKLIVDMLIASAYNHDGEWRIDDANKLLWHKFPDLQDLIDAVTFRVLHIRAARDLGKQNDGFSAKATCNGCKDWKSDGNGGITNSNNAVPSQAIQEIYSPNMKGAFSFECATAETIANYKAQLDYLVYKLGSQPLGAKAFDNLYPNGIVLNVNQWTQDVVYKRPEPWEPLPGDGVVFENPAGSLEAGTRYLNTLFLGSDLYYGHPENRFDPVNPGVLTEAGIIADLNGPDGTAAFLNRTALKPWDPPPVPKRLPK